MTALDDLIRAVEAADAPSREIDALVEVMFHEPPKLDAAMTPGEAGWLWATDGSQWKAPLYTASIDAVVALIRREMPGAIWMVEFVQDGHVLGGIDGSGVVHETPALALLLAFLRAVQAKQQDGADG